MMHTNVPLPEPLYSCAVPDCAGEQSFPADDLYYWDGIREDHFPARKGEEAGWYCDVCLDNMGIDSTSAPRLDREIDRRDATAAERDRLKELCGEMLAVLTKFMSSVRVTPGCYVDALPDQMVIEMIDKAKGVLNADSQQ